MMVGDLHPNSVAGVAFRTVNCKIQLPASVSVNLLSFKLGASCAICIVCEAVIIDTSDCPVVPSGCFSFISWYVFIAST